MKCKLAAIALICCATLMCSESNADLLGRMTARGCGDCQPAPTCCDTPANSCCGRNFGLSIDINIGCCGRLFRGRHRCDNGCAPACTPVVQDDCCRQGLFSRCGGGCRLRGCGRANDCGCDTGCDTGCCRSGLLTKFGGNRCCNTGYQAPAPCCQDACGCGMGGLLGNLRGRRGCCEEANDCGCEVNDCCRGGRIRSMVSNICGHFRSIGCNSCGNDCGCEAAPAMECDPCARRCNLGSRLHFRHNACNTCGEVDACGCNDRCGIMARVRGRLMSNDCGGCANSGCGCSATIGDEPKVEPVPAAETEGAYRQPIVDPSAFVIRNN